MDRALSQSSSDEIMKGVAEYQLQFKVDTDAMLGVLQGALQRTVDLVAVGLLLPDSADASKLRMPGSFFNFVPAEARRAKPDALRNDFRLWVLRCGFRDAMEAASVFLEDLRIACAAYWLFDPGKGPITGAEYNQALGPDPKRRFHRLGLPHKISSLAKNYDFRIPEANVAHLVTLNQARNCFVHRNGTVWAEDANIEGGLRIQWEKPELVVIDPSGDRVVSKKTSLPKEVRVEMRCRPAERSFAIGEVLSFSSADFSEFCWTFYQFGVAAITALNEYGIVHGVQRVARN